MSRQTYLHFQQVSGAEPLLPAKGIAAVNMQHKRALFACRVVVLQHKTLCLQWSLLYTFHKTDVVYAVQAAAVAKGQGSAQLRPEPSCLAILQCLLVFVAMHYGDVLK